MMDDSPSPDASPLDALDDQAHADGAMGVPREPAETLLSHHVAQSHVATLRDDVRDRLDAVEAQRDDIRQRRETRAETTALLEHLRSKRDDTSRRLANTETQREAAEEAQSSEYARGSVFYAGLYSLAGVFFIAGDVIMSREIVANALKLRGDVEPWIFAIGLAMLAILLKPAYDRLVETPYWNGNRGLFAGVIGVCGAGALATLWILGAFRSTAFVSNARIQRLTAELMEASDPSAIGAIQAEIGAIQQGLIESPLGYWAFVVSGVLFAVAGAVCLGIGVRHGRDAYHVRYRLHRARKRLDAECETLRATLADLNDRIAENEVSLQRQEQALADRPSLDALTEQAQALRDRLALLHDQHADVQSRQLQARYRHAHDRGQTGGRPPAPAESGDGMVPTVAAPTDTPSAPDASHAARGQRPYQMLRDLLLRNTS